MKEQLRVLILEDNPEDAEAMRRELQKSGIRFTSKCVTERKDFLEELHKKPPDIVLSDHGLPNFDGFTALHLVREKSPRLPFIFVTGMVNGEDAIEAFSHGASDYIFKSKLGHLGPAVKTALIKVENEQRHQEHEEQLRLILDCAKEFAIFTFDLNGRITMWNSGAQIIFGYTEEEILGREASILFTPEDIKRRQPETEMRTALDKDRAPNKRWHMRKNGERFWGSGYVMPFRDTQGNPTGFLKIMRDGTQEHLTQEALQRSEELYRTMVDGVENYAIYMLDPEGRVMTWNPGAEKVEGYRAEEIVGQNFSILFTDKDILEGMPKQELERAKRTGRSESEAWIVRNDGSVFWSNWTLTPVRDKNGKVLGFSKIAHDLTPRKQAEDEIRKLKEDLETQVRRRTTQLQASNRELEAFSYSVSHDLRAPLRHIHAYVELLNDKIGETLPEESRIYLEKISTSARKMGHLIDDLLTFSRMGRTEIRKININLSKLVEEARSEFFEEIRDRKVEWVIGNLPEVKGDPVMLRQVFLNLISNALKYSRQRPHARIEIGSEINDRETICYVRDNGAGFDMHFAQKLFGVFQRLHSDKDFPGTGIGLAIVRRVIHRHGGRTWAEGAIDEGATFYFSLPNN